ncbi:23S rRNA (uracil(1939)-C(5))-methyltransferase RlmD [Psychrobacter sp. HD31]|uniref:23S rRNA (uracil(1939)-C(5))-methyltransferase RlmD n=1 Tax=Psychrobacter sp. HD31 TaxID=3112003 RepID=UPI003DA4D51A
MRHKPANKKANQRFKQKNLTQKQKLPIIELAITGLTHDGRGVATYQQGEKQGKKVFVSFALPNEVVKAQLTNQRKNYEEAEAVEVIEPLNKHRQNPFCQHFAQCGGCSLQHWQADGQLAFKQSVLAEHFQHQADIQPDEWLTPIVGDTVGYRTKARLGVRYLSGKRGAKNNQGKLVLGFRERASNRLTNISQCPVLDKRINNEITNLKTLLKSLQGVQHITHIEVAVGEKISNLIDGDSNIAMIIRHVQPLVSKDIDKLSAFFEQRKWQLYLQPKGINSIYRVGCATQQKNTKKLGRLYYQLPDFGLVYEFVPTDFTQVNQSVNHQMVKQACDLLKLQPGERVLDLFSGLGNFSLPMAKLVNKQGMVIGVEGSNKMTQRAKDNAKRNLLENTQFYTQDLTQDLSKCEWASESFDALLIDPPRAGAWEVMQYIPKFNAKRIVYVSCDPATLARDSKALLEQGYKLTHAGVMDMFCHTAHVESIARFEKIAD